MMNFETIELEIDDSNNLAIVFLNRPNQLNALNIKLAEDLISALVQISNDNRVRCLIITGRGKAFCSGGDIMEFKNAKDPQHFISELVSRLHKAIMLLKNMKVVSVAGINGACFGAGLGFATASDFRISSENAKFGAAFTSVGLSPDSSSTFHLPKLVGLSLANEMIFLNRILTAEEALKFNLVNRIISSEKSFMEEVKKFALNISQGAPIAFSLAKKLLKKSYSNDLKTHLENEAESIIETAGTEDFQEGIKVFFEKRNPTFKGK